MSRRLTYLDHNATSPLRPEAREAMLAAMDIVGNPSSVHGAGRAARQKVETARAAVADLVGAAPDEVIFTGGATEANNIALRGLGVERVLVSAIEHDSVLAAVPEATRIPVDGAGVVDLAALAALLAAGPANTLVSVMLANNETGVIQPMGEIAKLCVRHGALLHCDAVQAAGKLPLRKAVLGADLLSLSAHKFGGPQGVGALVVPAALPVTPLAFGGGQERRRRPGTENVPAIVGFGAAARLAAEGLEDYALRLAALRDEAEVRLRELAPDAVVFAAGAARAPGTLSIAMPGVDSQTQLMALDLAGVCVSAGSACSSGKVTASHVLMAMGMPVEVAGSAIRISFGWNSTNEDVEALVAAWGALYRRRSPAAQLGAAS
ncbi:cysteine desulfurase family protein [Radicibacter daui]|uniref:cysteine desulfurase family protein n=1 Tax=Radicibacter daui TaxID=3064829 RepID=UPI004046ED07